MPFIRSLSFKVTTVTRDVRAYPLVTACRCLRVQTFMIRLGRLGREGLCSRFQVLSFELERLEAGCRFLSSGLGEMYYTLHRRASSSHYHLTSSSYHLTSSSYHPPHTTTIPPGLLSRHYTATIQLHHHRLNVYLTSNLSLVTHTFAFTFDTWSIIYVTHPHQASYTLLY